MIIRYSPKFLLRLKKVNVRIRKSFKEQITIFYKSPYSPQLHNHLLRDEYDGFRSIDITADYRALYEELQENKQHIAYFVAIGTHKELYGIKIKNTRTSSSKHN